MLPFLPGQSADSTGCSKSRSRFEVWAFPTGRAPGTSFATLQEPPRAWSPPTFSLGRDVQRMKRDLESKVELAVETLRQLAASKQQQAAWGQVAVKLFWENGQLKMIEIHDTTTIKDLTR